MSNSTLLIVGAAVVLLALVLFLLARTGRKPVEGPADGIAMVNPAVELSPGSPVEPLPEPGSPVSAPLATAELAEVPVTAAPAAAAGPADPLTRMKGLGPKAEAALNALGVSRYAQIASWTEADVTRIDQQMGAFKGRITRDRWVEQARLPATGDTAGFEATVGKRG